MSRTNRPSAVTSKAASPRLTAAGFWGDRRRLAAFERENEKRISITSTRMFRAIAFYRRAARYTRMKQTGRWVAIIGMVLAAAGMTGCTLVGKYPTPEK